MRWFVTRQSDLDQIGKLIKRHFRGHGRRKGMAKGVSAERVVRDIRCKDFGELVFRR